MKDICYEITPSTIGSSAGCRVKRSHYRMIDSNWA